jgi:hypothetical protein
VGTDAEAQGRVGGSVLIARGPRAAEELLFGRVASLSAEVRREPRLLALPVRIVVPSRSLGDHVGEQLVTRARGSLAGVRVQTLHGLALEMLERAGIPPPESDALFPLLVHHCAAEEPLLREKLGSLVDGYAAVEATVADLLDAGFDAGSSDAALDALESAGPGETSRETALAVARVARRCLDEMERGGIGQRALLLRAATEALLRDPDAALPARAVFVHGFADATGLRAELIEELVRRRHACVLIDEPPDPLLPAEADAGGRFTKRLRERLSLIARERAAEAPGLPKVALECVEAARPDGEVREVAARVRAALDAGARPEQIGVVARDLASFRALLRRHFGRLGIPFSGGREGGAGPRLRHLRALEALLREQAECRVERWLDARAPSTGAALESDLRLGLRRLGLVRLGDLAAHRSDGRDVKLPVVAGWWSEAAPETGEASHVERRRLRADALARAVADARAACARLARLGQGGACAPQLGELIALLGEDLGWDPRSEAWGPVHAKLEELRSALAPDFPLGQGDLALLVRRQLIPHCLVPLGGSGGGVQVLDATEARGRSFQHLFLMGLTRDAFPRSVSEDPLLPDVLREHLRDVLPEVPIKKLGLDEERFLFAELLASAPRVTLSWPLASDEGRPCARSSFVERLRWGGVFEKPEAARSVLARAPGGAEQRLGLEEHLLRAALFAPKRLAAILPIGLRGIASEILARRPPAEVASLAAARLAVLNEMEGQALRGVPRLGPYFGFVGAQRAANDPRAARLYVTTLERLSRCGWQTFLERLLRLEAPPDSGGALPGIDRQLLGSAVHRTIDTVFAESGAGWPDEARLAALADAAALAVLEEEGVPLRGLARVLARQALPFLLRARTLDLGEPQPIEVVAVERERSIDVSDLRGREQRLYFRADRIERVGGRERLTDFKTGRPISDKKKPETRRADFRAAIASGGALQPVAYARSAQDEGSGRLLYLRPDLPEDAAEFSAPRGDEDLGRAFDTALHGLFDAWDQGSFFPRMLGPDLEETPRACRNCDVAQACLLGDTGARRRLSAWLEQASKGGAGALEGAERSLLNLFRLGEGTDSEAEDAP